MKVQDILNKYEDEYIFSILKIENHSLNSNTKFKVWFDHFRKFHDKIDGDIFEFGVYRGNSLISMAILMKRFKSRKKIYGFDSFSGFPNYSAEDDFKQFMNNKKIFDRNHLKNIHIFEKLNKALNNKLDVNKISSSKDFSGTTYNYLKSLIKLFELDNVILIKGDFAKTVPKFFRKYDKNIFSANIDCDLYLGYKICLPIIWDKLMKNGMIYLDEYYSLKFPGPRIACNEFFRERNIKSLKTVKEFNKFDRNYLIK